MISLLNRLVLEDEKMKIQQMKLKGIITNSILINNNNNNDDETNPYYTKAIHETLESTELEKLISKCVNLQTTIDKGIRIKKQLRYMTN